QFLRLGRGGLDLLMLDQGRGHVAQQGRAVAGLALQLAAAVSVLHLWYSVRKGPVSGSPVQAAVRVAAITRYERRPKAEGRRKVKRAPTVRRRRRAPIFGIPHTCWRGA